MEPKPAALPDDVALAELQWLLGGLTRQRISQLEKSGVIERSGHGRYRMSSVPAYFAWLKARGDGPLEWRNARTELARERAAMAKLDRLQREGELASVADFEITATYVINTVRQHFLATPTKIAAKWGMVTNAIEAEKLVRAELYEAMRDLATLATMMPGQIAARLNGGGAPS